MLSPGRGLAYWKGPGEARLFVTVGSALMALDPATGVPIVGFGVNGRVDLREGLDRDPASVALTVTTPGVVPAVYAVDGRQFVVIACGGGKLGAHSADAYVAFALPEKR